MHLTITAKRHPKRTNSDRTMTRVLTRRVDGLKVTENVAEIEEVFVIPKERTASRDLGPPATELLLPQDFVFELLGNNGAAEQIAVHPAASLTR